MLIPLFTIYIILEFSLLCAAIIAHSTNGDPLTKPYDEQDRLWWHYTKLILWWFFFWSTTIPWLFAKKLRYLFKKD